MKFKLALLCATAVLGSLALVQPAAAAGSSITVTTTPGFANICRPAANAEQLQFSFTFSAKIKKKHTTNPKSVVASYTVEDVATGAPISSGKVTLTAKNKWKNISKPITVAAGAAVEYKYKAVYRAPNTGKLVTATATKFDNIPSSADMDAANAANPTTPPFPTCV